uniref:TROVE domain-containing protein n=1 Tax=Leersia perrieri TaxID=77586 RepID=A0A0D9WSQ3_9ORYZ
MASASATAAMCRRASYTLLGPPAELLRVEVSEAVARVAATTASTGDPFVDMLHANFNKPPPPPPPPPAKRLTENSSPTFTSSGDPCLDFFFHVVPDTPPSTVTTLLSAAWAAEPDTALRLACNLRGVRGNGKSDREGFYSSALWMHDHHPNTLALNSPTIAEFGYLKDLPELLHRIIHGGVSTYKPTGRSKSRNLPRGLWRHLRHKPGSPPPRYPNTREARVAASLKRHQKISDQAAVSRWRKRVDDAARAVEMYARNPSYRFLHERTADLFAELISQDLKKVEDGTVWDLSLASKWCPSLNSCYDQSTLLCEAISRRLFPKGSCPDLHENLPDEHYAYRARERLRKSALVPLRRVLHVPEVYISARRWGDVVYTRVTSVAMKNYTDLFLKHDKERFSLYLGKVKSGKVKIASGALLPHEILEEIEYYGDEEEGSEVANLQWKSMVDDLLALGKLTNCLAVCDVSGSMTGQPMDVCVALGLLLSELCDEPWRHRVITFSHRPQLHRIEGETLYEKTRFIREMDWQMNTDFQAVFDKLLHVAVSGNLPPERMVKKVFVFSDMEFDQASSRPWETDYEAITRKFTEAGYGDAIPEIVFWNLRDTGSVPVTTGQKGVALVSGFSKNMVKLFLKGGHDTLTPRAAMERAISGKEYEKLVVFD